MRRTSRYAGALAVLLISAPAVASAQAPRGIEQATPEVPLTRPEVEALLEKHRGETLTIVNYGGAAAAAERNAFYIPFQEKFGIKVVEDTNPLAAKIQAMVESNNVTWDVLSLGQFEVINLGKKGLLEELDRRIVDGRTVLPALKSPWGGGGGLNVYATVLAFNTDKYPEGGPRPSSWADFWDTEKLPGRRGYGDFMTGHLEIPLLAAGLAPKDITFPLSNELEETTFSLLEDLAGKIDVYWSAGTTCPELLIKGELDMCSAWNGRIFDAQKAGAPIEVCWTCGFALGGNAFTIPKGTPNRELAELFIAWSGLPENLVQYSKYIPYGPGDTRALELLPQVVDAATLAQLPTSEQNLPHAVFVDEGWEGENYNRLHERYQRIFQEKAKTSK